MHITKLLEFETKFETKNVKRPLRGNTVERTKTVARGEGLGAVVYDAKDPHTVNRVSKWRVDDKLETPEKGYRNYIEAITKHPSYKGNPYFPRIYSVRDFVDNMGMRKTRYNMETLDHIKEQHIAIAILNKIFGENLDKMLNFYDLDENMLTKKSADDIVQIIAKEITKCIIRGNRFNYIADSKFLEACFIISKIEMPRTRLDIRPPNLMYRTGPMGPQLVITDPFV